MLFFAQIKLKQYGEELFGLFPIEIAFARVVESIEEFYQKQFSFLHDFFRIPFQSVLKLIEHISKQEIHEKVKTHDEKTDEVEDVPIVVLVGLQHDVGKVGSGQQNSHAVISLTDI